MAPEAVAGAGERVVDRCRRLALVSEEEGRLTRPFASEAMARANARVSGWMEEAGLTTHLDAAGNLVGRLAGTGEREGVVLLGSHLDTVRDAGAFDGPLGVSVALEALEALRSDGRELAFDVEVVGFSDEEGLRYGTAYLGSRAIAGTFDPGLLELVDGNGIRMADALRAFGGEPDGLAAVAREPGSVLAYVEVHMEQGPVLEAAELPLAVVSAIAGATRAEACFVGRAEHAGTVPMAGRRDALCAAAEWTLDVEAEARAGDGLLCTVGVLRTHPGATNVIPGAAVATLDARHPDDAVRRTAVAALRERAEQRAQARGLGLEWVTHQETPATVMDPALGALLAEAVSATGYEARWLPSGAGHDAVALASLAPVAMLFVRCAGGISHRPDESVEPADAAVAVAALVGLLERL